MSDGGTLQVDTDALCAHAKRIEGLAQGLTEGVQAGKAAIDGMAFGALCSFLVPGVSALEEAGIDSLTFAASALAGDGGGLRSVAKGYDETDEAVGAQFTELSKGMS